MRIDSTKIMMSHGKMTPPLLNRSNPYLRYHCTQNPGFRPVVLPAALTASDGLDRLLSAQQRLEGKATSATAGFDGPATSRAAWEANVASRISR